MCSQLYDLRGCLDTSLSVISTLTHAHTQSHSHTNIDCYKESIIKRLL
jgi:hypothetical protein